MPYREGYEGEEGARRKWADWQEERRRQAELTSDSRFDTGISPGYVGDESIADNPALGWLTGETARRTRLENRQDQERAQQMWLGIGGGPTWQELAPQYREGTTDEYGNLIGDPSAYNSLDPEGRIGQHRSMEALQNLMANGGYTSADRAASQAMRAQQAQALGSANQAALQQAQARGMGASGAELGMRMQGSEAANYANSQADAGLQMAAMQRMLAATQGAGQLGTAMRGQELERAGALDRFNQANLDWRRGRELRSTELSNQEGAARQQAYRNNMDWAQGMADLYQGAQINRRADDEPSYDAGRAQVRAAGSLASGIGGGYGGGGGGG